MFLPELRQPPRLGLQKNHAVAIRRSGFLDRRGVGLPARAFHGGVNHGLWRSPDDRATVAGKRGWGCLCPSSETGSAADLRGVVPAVAAIY